MKNNMLIHRMADWLDKKYLSQKTLSAFARLPWYDTMASNENPATTSISARRGRQNQPRATAPGMAASKMPFSYTSIAAL